MADAENRANLQLQQDTGFKASEIAYMGDDLPDLPIMTQVGLAIAPTNAHDFVKQHAHWITQARGGAGAAREAIDYMLNAQGLLASKQASYLE